MAISMASVGWDLCLARVAPPVQDRRLHLRDGSEQVAAWFGVRSYQEQELPVAAVLSDLSAAAAKLAAAEAQIGTLATFTDQFGVSWPVLVCDARGLPTVQLDGTVRVDLTYAIIVQETPPAPEPEPEPEPEP